MQNRVQTHGKMQNTDHRHMVKCKTQSTDRWSNAKCRAQPDHKLQNAENRQMVNCMVNTVYCWMVNYKTQICGNDANTDACYTAKLMTIKPWSVSCTHKFTQHPKFTGHTFLYLYYCPIKQRELMQNLFENHRPLTASYLFTNCLTLDIKYSIA